MDELAEARGALVSIGGEDRRLVYDFNALAAIEERTGRNMLDGKGWLNPSARDLRAFIWGGLLHESPELAIEDVGRWLTEGNLSEIVAAFVRARSAAAPSGAAKGEAKAGSQGNPRRSGSRG